jgi:hypothetical protein
MAAVAAEAAQGLGLGSKRFVFIHFRPSELKLSAVKDFFRGKVKV